ncbi:pyridoxamine 5'-phosphate oxidase family protein [Streptomyces sp. CA-250714]|uniref:pyridoxamine 5'-phosphate oxidase family protein n=1 Tax=Streptomyces sp. CA-250714 TaxID=3240060 RepID=UPI003D950183
MAALSDANGYGDGSAGHIAGTDHGVDTDHGPPRRLPGSDGEHALQQRIGSDGRAGRFYQDQVLDHLNERMREFTRQQEMFFLATADRHGECDSSFRAGPPGFLRVLDERTLVFPEYRGNGVHASLGNIEENPHVGILLIDFLRARIGLHINGRAEVLDDAELRPWVPDLPQDPVPGRRAVLWVRVEVEEAYIHCAKHIPHLQKAPRRPAREWGTDDHKRKGGDFFGAARDAREARREAAAATRTGTAATEAVPEPTSETAAAEEVASALGEDTLTLAAPPLPPGLPPVPGAPPAPATAAAAAEAATGAPHVPPVPAAPPVPVVPPAPTTPPAPEPAHEPASESAHKSAPEPAHEPASEPAPEPAPEPAANGQPAAAEPEPAAELEPAYAAGPPPLPRRRHAAPAPSTAAPTPSAAVPAASSAVSAAISARSGNGETAEHARDISAWRLEAERALAEAQRRGRSTESDESRETAPFQGWFG